MGVFASAIKAAWLILTLDKTEHMCYLRTANITFQVAL